jgi:threonylcarbamoyladenosine tRNA methylthiotransferase MtaB
MKIYFDSIGCRLNQSEIETYARQFRSAGHYLVADPAEADLVIINTCSVTSAADSDSRQKIRQAAHAGAREVIVTGCWSSLNPEKALSLPAVSRLVHNLNKDQLVSDLLNNKTEGLNFEPVARRPVPGSRSRTRAFIKVQDGCNNRCTFCITTIARGKSRSRTKEQILSDIQYHLNEDGSNNAAKEIVLTGVHLGSWGKDLSPRKNLDQLIHNILKETEIPRLRLSSLEPWELDKAFFDLWENPRLCRQLHLPLQSGCEATLRRMARNITPQDYAELVNNARKKFPDIAVTTDIIAGFPGEDDDEFNQSLEFIQRMKFADGHVFSYSERPGTAAAEFVNQVPHSLRKERNAIIREVIAQSRQDYLIKFKDQILPVLWESALKLNSQHWQLTGLTDNYLRVNTTYHQNLWNQISPVYLHTLKHDGYWGEIKSS